MKRLGETGPAGMAVERWKTVFWASAAALIVTALVEFWMGRSIWGPDGKFGLWQGSIWDSECSQRLADPYSFSHIAHGILFYAFLWAVGRHWRVGDRFLAAILLEAGWEVLENSPLIIERYRKATIALGYNGDSIVNSVGDILMMTIGFALALRLRPWMSIGLLIAMEVGCLLWIRDNLTLNVIMLLYPLQAIKAWQAAGHPG